MGRSARAAEYSWLGVGLGDDLATRLAHCDRHLFQVERLQFNDVLRAQQMEMLTQGVSAALEPDTAERTQLQQLAQAARASFPGQQWEARYVIVGSLWLEGTYPQDQARLKANVRLVKVATGQIISSVQATSDGSEDGYVRLQEQLAEQLSERLGADPTVVDKSSWTPLYRAIESGRAKVVAPLLAAGADPTVGASPAAGTILPATPVWLGR